jgi:hypothetical protein
MEGQKLQSVRDEKTGLLVLHTVKGEHVGTIGTAKNLAKAGIIELGSFIDRSKYMFINAAGEIEKGVFYTTEEEALNGRNDTAP